MSVSTDASENCPRCQVVRAPLPEGGWCSTCGYNPTYEKRLSRLDRIEKAAGPFTKMSEITAIAGGFNYSMVRELRAALAEEEKEDG